MPEQNLLGSEHGGFYLIMANFQWERLLMALGAIGATQACFEQTVSHVRAHEPLCGQQAIRHQLAEIAVTIEAGRAVTYHALRRFVAGEDAVREVTIAKLRTQRAAFDAIDPLPADPRSRRRTRARAGGSRRPAWPDRRRHRRDHARDPRPLAGALTPATAALTALRSPADGLDAWAAADRGPHLLDPNFFRTVVLVIEHSDEGALGLS